MSKEVESEIHEDNLCATTSESLTNDETERKSFASKNEDGPLVNEHISKRTEKKIMNGMGLLLQQLRSSGESQVLDQEKAPINESIEIVKETLDEPQKFNRKERRALLRQQYAEKIVDSEQQTDTNEENTPPEKHARLVISVEYSIDNPRLVFSETASFLEKCPQFGFAEFKYTNNYVKLSKFSPNGELLASTSQDRVARIFRLDPTNLELTKAAHIPLGDLPYDAVWHPCGDLLATSSRLHPIHLWNTSGEREASYRGINHLDELSAAQTMAFSNDGLRLYAGYNKCIRIWDVRHPGKHQYEVKTWRKQPYAEGQKARVSSISVHPYFDGVYAVGTYGPTIGLYSDRTNFVECLFSGDFQAVTQIKYSPDGMRLYSCGRKTGTIQCFDLRNPGTVLFTLHRPFETQQRVYFDVDSSEKFLFSGTSNGEIAVFDLKDGDINRNPISVQRISSSSVPCTSLHPSLPIVAACTGERIFPFPELPDDEELVDVELSSRSYLDINNEKDLSNTIQLWQYSI